jgi:hypothetical protein
VVPEQQVLLILGFNSPFPVLVVAAVVSASSLYELSGELSITIADAK